jgi:hypothetical protein
LTAAAFALLQLWRQHWDFQLYKALDVQYREGLESINKTLPEVGSTDNVVGSFLCGQEGERFWC